MVTMGTRGVSSVGSSTGAVLTPAWQGTLHIAVIGRRPTLGAEGHQDSVAKARPPLEKRYSARQVLVLLLWGTVTAAHSVFALNLRRAGHRAQTLLSLQC